MHGEIKLDSEPGRGTKTMFWLPFHKAHLKAGDSDSAAANSMSKKAHSELSVPGRISSPQNASMDLQNGLSNPLNVPLGLMQRRLNAEAADGAGIKGVGELDRLQSAVDRQSIRVLVVEDK